MNGAGVLPVILSLVAGIVVLVLSPAPLLAALVAGAAVLLAAWLVARPEAALAPVPPAETSEGARAASMAANPQITALIDLFAEGVLLLDAERQVIAANLAAARILGRPRDAMIGVSLIRAARDHALVDVLREAAGEPREVVLGEQQVIFATASAVESGPIRTVLSLQDLTALRRAERARQELVANVSHELRTPIAAARALAETLESGVDDEAQRARFHEQLTTEIERLAQMVDRLLHLSRLESRLEEFRLEDIPALDLLEEARAHIEPVAERAGVSLEVQAPEDPSLAVHADRERVLEVLSNLLDNAIRHSPRGGQVTLSARPDADLVRLSVSDQGAGIMPKDRSRIFERFYTGDRARSDGRGTGTGLGLAIARHIVMRHGGEIWVSDRTPGATLCFTLPPAARRNDI